MQIKDKCRLAFDITGGGKERRVYGKKGEHVVIISISDIVAVVEGKRERYPVLLNELIKI